MQLNRTQSKTSQVIRCIEAQIRSGALPRGSVLRSTRLLAADFHVSSQVIRYACDYLEDKGLIRRKPRSGTIVNGMDKFLLVLNEQDVSTAKDIVLSELHALAQTEFVELDLMPVEIFRSSPPAQLLKALKKEHYKGVMLMCCGYNGNEPELELLRKLDLPVCHPVSVFDEESVTGFKNFKLDTEKGLSLAGEALKDKGRKNILMLINRKTDAEKFPPIWSRYGIIPADVTELPGNWDSERIKASFERLFAEKKFDAVACHSGGLAALLYQYCSSRGIVIPRDMSVINFGWGGAGKFLSPKLTEVDYRLKEHTRCVWEWLLHGRGVIPEVRLIHGESI